MSPKPTCLQYRTVVRNCIETHSPIVFWGALIAIMAFGVLQAMPRLGFNLNVDEPFTANVVHLSLPEIARFYKDDLTPAYYLLLKGWVTVFGESEVGLRSLSVLFYGLTALAVGVSARWVCGTWGGLLAALLVSTSSLGLIHASTARAYAMLGFEVSIAILLYLYLMRPSLSLNTPIHRMAARTNRLLYIAITVTHIVGLFTHPIYLFFLGACIVATLLVSRRTFFLVAISGIASLCIYLVLGYSDLRVAFTSAATHWMTSPNLGNLLLGFFYLWTIETFIVLGICLALILIFCLKKGISPPFSKAGLYSFGIIALTSIVPFLVSQFRPVFFGPRTLILVLPTACILAAYFVSRPITRFTMLFVVVVALAAVMSSVQISLQTALGSDRYPVRQSIQHILVDAHCDDTFVLGGLSYSEVEYYLRRSHVPPECIHRESYPLETASHPGWVDIPTLLDNRDQLESEASATALRLSLQPSSRVWLFDSNAMPPGTDATGDLPTSYGHRVTQIIKNQLDCQMVSTRVLDLRGTGFNSVILYINRQEEFRSQPCN